ncbi:MAG: pilus assembly protein PilM [Deltaproteobacteria bacterium]
MFNKPKILFEIGNYSIKLVETCFDKSKGKITLSNYAVIPIPGAEAKVGISFDSEILAELIRKEINTSKWKAKEAIGVLSDEGTISRDILIPKVPEKKIEAKVREDAGQHLPVDINDYLIDYRVLYEMQTEEGPKYKIYIVAAPYKIIDKYIEVVKMCKLSLDAIDISGNALSKLLAAEVKSRNEVIEQYDAIMGLNIGAKRSCIVFVQNGAFQFEREIVFGANEIVQVLSKNLKVDFKQAQDELITNMEKHFSLKQNNEVNSGISKDVADKLGIFAAELEKIISFYQMRYSCKNVQKIYLAGGASKIEGISDFIEERVHISCTKIADLKCVIDNSKKDFNKDAAVLANVIGASIRN